MAKKVVILIVEGQCDETLLIDRLRELFAEQDIRFEAQGGDILYDIKNQKPIKDIVGDVVKKVLIKRKYKPTDILAVIQIIDTDGCLIPEDKILIDDSQEIKTLYKNECISVPNEKQKYNIKIRNEVRSRNIHIMNSVRAIVSNKYNYQMFYFSRNLEHVLFDEPNPCDETKLDNIESFLDNLTQPIEDYLQQFIPALTKESYDDQYVESWNKINQGIESLKRSTNIPLMINYIKLITTE